MPAVASYRSRKLYQAIAVPSHMENPYAAVDWESVHRLHSVNHVHTFSANSGHDYWDLRTEHLDGQSVFEGMYESGIRHFALSNYHPAKPTYPLADFFDPLPEDALGCPNAESHSTEVSGHYCTLGSYFQSGDGYEASWQVLFRDALAQLAYDGGGGIVINHPKRTGLSVETLTERLDFDPRVLGIEAYNHRSEEKPKYDQTGDALDIWDELLSTGRTVYGFFNPDSHSPWIPAPDWTERMLGRNVLLVPEPTEEAAARAYREGRFYGAFAGTGLRFEYIRTTDDGISVGTNGATRIDVISGGEIVQSTDQDTATYQCTGDEQYLRVEARDGDGERIFSQPITFDDSNA